METSNCSVCLSDFDRHEGTGETLLTQQLSIIFLVHDILQVPFKECTKYLEKYGNPAEWITLCPACIGTLNEAQEISNHIQRLKNQLHILHGNFINPMMVKIETPQTDPDEDQTWLALTAASEIRNYVSLAQFQGSTEDEGQSKSKNVYYPGPGDLQFADSEPLEIDASFFVENVVDMDDVGSFKDRQEETRSSKSECVCDPEWQPSEELDDFDCANDEAIVGTSRTAFESHKDSNDKHNSHNVRATRSSQLQNGRNILASEGVLEVQLSKGESLHALLDATKIVSQSNKCPVCKKSCKSEELWKKHITLKHKKYLAHLSEQVPEDHICLAGQCLPRQSSRRKKSGSVRSRFTKHKRGKYRLSKKRRLELKRERENLSTTPKKPNKPLHCKQCPQTFPTKPEILDHMKKIHGISGFECKLCAGNYTTIYSLENHIRMKHSNPSIFLCAGCNTIIKCMHKFSNHLKQKPVCQEKALTCKECSRFFPTQEAHDVHVEFKHTQPPPLPAYACTTCNQRFNTPRDQTRHIAAFHTNGQRPFKCEKCEKSFVLSMRLNCHMQTVHLNKEPDGTKYICSTCDMVFTRKSNLRRHEKLHLDDAPFLCTVCGKRYKVGNQLTVHMWSHDPDRHEKYSLYKKKSKSINKVEATVSNSDAPISTPEFTETNQNTGAAVMENLFEQNFAAYE